MKQSDLKILIKKVQNECALEEPTKITYYWNDDGKLVFKLFFDSLIIPEELMVDEDNISKCFSEQNVYEFEDDFVIKELNREKGFVEIIPDDQKFKVINSYKDYNEDEKVEKDHKEESVVRLAGNRISEDFAKTKGFILRESEEGVAANSYPYIFIAFTMYMLNDGNKQEFVKYLNTLFELAKTFSEKPKLKLIINVPQTTEQFTGVEAFSNLPLLFKQIEKFEDMIYILNSDKCTDIIRTADPAKSIFYTAGTDMVSSLQKAGASKFKNNSKLYNEIDEYYKKNCLAAYNAFFEKSKKSYEAATKAADAIVKAFLKHYNVKEHAAPDAVAKKFKNSPEWPKAFEEYTAIKDQNPPSVEWRSMHFIEMYFSEGKDQEQLEDSTGWKAALKDLSKINTKAIKDLKDCFSRGTPVGITTVMGTLAKDTGSTIASLLANKSAGGSNKKGDYWQDDGMKDGVSGAGVDFGDKEPEKKVKGDLINPLYFFLVYIFFASNKKPLNTVKEELTFDPTNIKIKKSSEENQSNEKDANSKEDTKPKEPTKDRDGKKDEH